MKITDDDAIVAFLKAANAVPVREPGWFDVEQAALMFGGYSINGALALLNKAVEAGDMEMRLVYDPEISRRRKVWRVKNETEATDQN